MPNNIILKKSSTNDKVPLPGDLQYGELALNFADGNLFYKNTANAITTIASNKFVSVTGNVTAVGNIQGNYFIGNGSQLTGISGGSSVGGTFPVIARSGTITVSVASGFFSVVTRNSGTRQVAVA
jgi:hypothetical protein